MVNGINHWPSNVAKDVNASQSDNGREDACNKEGSNLHKMFRQEGKGETRRVLI